MVLVGPPQGDDIWPEATVIAALNSLIGEMGLKRASTEVAEQSGWAKRDVYQLALSLK